jgi:hypothetical protein
MEYANRSYLDRRRTPAEACGRHFMAGDHRRRMRHDGGDCVLVSFRRAVARRHFGPSDCRRHLRAELGLARRPAVPDTWNQPHPSARRVFDDRGRAHRRVEQCRAHDLDRGADGIGRRRQIVSPRRDCRSAAERAARRSGWAWPAPSRAATGPIDFVDGPFAWPASTSAAAPASPSASTRVRRDAGALVKRQ